MVEIGSFQTEIDVGALLMTLHGSRAEEPNGLQMGLGHEQLSQLLLSFGGNSWNSGPIK
jgi:hypothetical protein